MLAATLLFSATAAAHPSSIAQDTPQTTTRSIALDQFVLSSSPPDFDREVLIPLHEAQAKKAVADAEAAKQAQIAEDARIAAQTAQRAQIISQQVSQASIGAIGNLYTPGQCTWYVASRVGVPSTMGNATNWESGLLAAGWHYGLGGGSIGVSHAGYTGHVVYVESVVLGVVTISEMNATNGPFGVDTRVALPGEFVWLAK